MAANLALLLIPAALVVAKSKKTSGTSTAALRPSAPKTKAQAAALVQATKAGKGYQGAKGSVKFNIGGQHVSLGGGNFAPEQGSSSRGFGDTFNQFLTIASGGAYKGNASVAAVGNKISQKLTPAVDAGINYATDGLGNYVNTGLGQTDTATGSINTSAPDDSTTVSTDSDGNSTYLPDSV